MCEGEGTGLAGWSQARKYSITPIRSGTYLLIVDDQWVDGKVQQRVLLRLGHLDELLASGQVLTALLKAGASS